MIQLTISKCIKFYCTKYLSVQLANRWLKLMKLLHMNISLLVLILKFVYIKIYENKTKLNRKKKKKKLGIYTNVRINVMNTT